MCSFNLLLLIFEMASSVIWQEMGLYSIIINPHKHFLFPFAITFAYLTCTALTWYLTSQVLQVFVCSQIQPAIELPQLHR